MQLAMYRRSSRTLMAALALVQLSGLALGIKVAPTKNSSVSRLPSTQPEPEVATNSSVSRLPSTQPEPEVATNSSVSRLPSTQPEPEVATNSSVSRLPSTQPKPEVATNLSAISRHSSKPKLQALVGHLAKVQVKQSPRFLSHNIVSPDSCSCEFRGICSCEAAIEFMDCITDKCNSGTCDCEATQFHHACESMAGTCSMEMLCTEDKATCLVQEEADLWARNRTTTTIYEELVELKEDKCRLELAAEDGWLNAAFKLKSVALEIDKRMKELKAYPAPLPEMHCEKHFEEWHEEHMPKPKVDARSSSRYTASPPLVTSAFAAISAILMSVVAADGNPHR
eukprot:TRINITY_DN1151_c0_g1_i3.p1 TRINITY_DN1151_c0_g1~~TRINITY_DN1151_c0_g1_i3.p1  ORF type:complete len:339 (-),score=50.41 TRINITY_DN1151_c0_g1_i3:138-1154(-)